MSHPTAPEIGMGAGFVFGAITFVVGILAGIHEPLWLQFLFVVAGAFLLNSWYISGLELGALVYVFIYVLGIIGLIVGDISYMIQTDVEVWDTLTGWLTFSTDAFIVK